MIYSTNFSRTVIICMLPLILSAYNYIPRAVDLKVPTYIFYTVYTLKYFLIRFSSMNFDFHKNLQYVILLVDLSSYYSGEWQDFIRYMVRYCQKWSLLVGVNLTYLQRITKEMKFHLPGISVISCQSAILILSYNHYQLLHRVSTHFKLQGTTLGVN